MVDNSSEIVDSSCDSLGVSRRSVTRGALWSVPVVSTAVSVPAVAASVVFESLVFDQLTANGGSGLPDSPTPNRIFGTGDEIS
ncbi:MAG: hypothetical protein QM613_06835, partial [Micrococcaceae bacterium]